MALARKEGIVEGGRGVLQARTETRFLLKRYATTATLPHVPRRTVKEVWMPIELTEG